MTIKPGRAAHVSHGGPVGGAPHPARARTCGDRDLRHRGKGLPEHASEGRGSRRQLLIASSDQTNTLPYDGSLQAYAACSERCDLAA